VTTSPADPGAPLGTSESAVTPRLVVGASVLGPAHIRLGLPNQDAIAWTPSSGGGDGLVVAVSDGHGAPEHFRSDAGSALAVAAALDKGKAFLLTDLAGEEALRALAAAIVATWHAGVEVDLARRPFSEAELLALERAAGPEVRAEVQAEPVLAYGATLLVALVEGDAATLLQLGDGDILSITDEGADWAIPPDPRLFGGVTTSLCLPEAEEDFRFGEVLSGPGGGYLLLATDGFRNAFADEESFLMVGPDVWRCAAEGGLDAVAENLGPWLEEAASYSGDDVTAAVVSLLPT